jgi:chromosomal replication initiator protein
MLLTPKKFYFTKPAMEIAPQYRFDTFAAGESSRLAFAACNAVAESGESQGNPLVLIGGTGLGKTHLLHSTANALHSKRTGLKIICTAALEFYEEYAKNALQIKENPSLMDEMSTRFRNADVLILDDLQNIERKFESQHELLQIFNILLLAGKPIIVASQVSISGIDNLDESLRSRLTGGLVIQISTPTFIDRLAILRKKFDMIGLNVNETVLQFLAEKTNGSTVHDLEGIRNTIGFKVKQINRNADLEMASEVLEEHFSNTHRTLSMEAIIKTVSTHYGISIEILKQKGRGSKESVLARQVAMYFIRNELNKSFEHIGKYFNRDHSTAIYACKLVENKIKKEMPFSLETKRIKKNLYE